MQNKGAVKLFAIIFGLVCIFQLSFTYISWRYTRKADTYSKQPAALAEAKIMARGDAVKEAYFLDSISQSRLEYFNDSMANTVVYNILLKEYTLKDVREREINLGLDLKGGMNVTMEVSVPEIIRALSGYSQDVTFNKAMTLAIQKEKSSTKDFVDLFAEAFKEIDPNAKLASIFTTVELKEQINFNTTNEEVINVIRKESNAAIDMTYQILRTRIDRFGVAQPNINKLQTAGRILIELPGIKDPARVRKLLQGTAQLEFWETYRYHRTLFLFRRSQQAPGRHPGSPGRYHPDRQHRPGRRHGSPESRFKPTRPCRKKGRGKKAEEPAKDTAQENALLKQLEKDTTQATAGKDQKSFEEYAKGQSAVRLPEPGDLPEQRRFLCPRRTGPGRPCLHQGHCPCEPYAEAGCRTCSQGT